MQENPTRKSIRRDENFHHVEKKPISAGARLSVDRETRRSIVRQVLTLGKSLREVQLSTMRNGRVLNQDAILQTVIEHISDQQQAEMERVRLEAERKVQSYRRALVGELRRTA